MPSTDQLLRMLYSLGVGYVKARDAVDDGVAQGLWLPVTWSRRRHASLGPLVNGALAAVLLAYLRLMDSSQMPIADPELIEEALTHFRVFELAKGEDPQTSFFGWVVAVAAPGDAGQNVAPSAVAAPVAPTQPELVHPPLPL